MRRLLAAAVGEPAAIAPRSTRARTSGRALGACAPVKSVVERRPTTVQAAHAAGADACSWPEAGIGSRSNTNRGCRNVFDRLSRSGDYLADRVRVRRAIANRAAVIEMPISVPAQKSELSPSRKFAFSCRAKTAMTGAIRAGVTAMKVVFLSFEVMARRSSG